MEDYKLTEKKSEEILNEAKKIPVLKQLIAGLNLIRKIMGLLGSKKAKEEKIKQMEEKHKKSMKVARKIETLTKNYPKNEDEKIKKDKKLREYFDSLPGI